jgi:predicted HicB family RNase H-like nuclease
LVELANNAVLIRGLDREIYNNVVAKAKQQGKNVADLVNEALSQYVRESPAENHNVFDTKKLVIAGSVLLSKSDIMGLHKELGSFHLENSGELTFDKDVDWEAFQKIEGIQNTGKLRVPADVHHFALLKAGHVRGEVEKY